MKRKLLLLTAISAAVFMTGCGGNKSNDERVVTVYGRANYEGFESFVVEEFAKAHPEIKLEFVEGPANTNEHYANVQAALMAQDESMDVFYADSIWTPTFASAGWLHSIELSDEERAQFIPGGVDAYAYLGKQYGLPMFVDGGQLYYRKDLLEKYNREVPETWDEMMDTAEYVIAAEKAEDPGSTLDGGFAASWKQYEGITCALTEFIWGHGGDVIDAEGNIVINSPETIAAFAKMKEVYDRTGVPGVDTFETGNVRNSFSNGQAMFSRDWPSFPVSFERDKATDNMELGIAKIPHAEGKESFSTLGGFGVAISNFSENKEDAETFLKFRTSKLIQKQAALRLGRAPSRIDLYEDVELIEGHPTLEQMLPGLLNVKARPQHPFYNDISSLIQQAGHDVIKGIKTPEEAVQWLEVEMNRI